MIARPPRRPIDLEATTKDVRLRLERVWLGSHEDDHGMMPDRKDVEVARAWVRQAFEEDIAERIAGLEAVLVDIIEKPPETLAANLVTNGLEWLRSSDIEDDDAGEPLPMPH